jgi:hypothetical protein
MRFSLMGFCRHGILLTVTILAGCGALREAQDGAQSQIGAAGVIPQSRATATSAEHGWGTHPGANSGELLYAAGQGFGYVFTYPAGIEVAQFKLAPRYKHAIANGLCSDSNGNVFVTAAGAGFTTVYEYAHGSTVPFATLHPSVVPVSCSSDPTSGDLAVVSSFPTEGLHSVAIYANAQGAPKMYYVIPNMMVYAFCAYDNAGDFFVDGESKNSHFVLSELPKGSGAFTNITLKGLKTSNPGNV